MGVQHIGCALIQIEAFNYAKVAKHFVALHCAVVNRYKALSVVMDLGKARSQIKNNQSALRDTWWSSLERREKSKMEDRKMKME